MRRKRKWPRRCVIHWDAADDGGLGHFHLLRSEAAGCFFQWHSQFSSHFLSRILHVPTRFFPRRPGNALVHVIAILRAPSDRPTGAASFEVKSSVRAALSSLARAARRPPICPVDRPCRFNICIPPRADVQLTRAAALFLLCGSSSDWTLHLRRFSYWNARSRGCLRRLSLMLRKVTRVIYLFIITFIVSWVNMIHLETPLRALCRDFLYSVREIN